MKVSKENKMKAAYKLVEHMADNSNCKISFMEDCDCIYCVAHLIVHGKKPTITYKVKNGKERV